MMIKTARELRKNAMSIQYLSNIKIADVLRVLLDKEPARLHTVAHENLEEAIRFRRILHGDE